MLGWTMNMEGGMHGMVVFGLGANMNSTHREDLVYAPKSGGNGYNDLVKSTRDDSQLDVLNVPFLMGAEVEVSKFAKCSGVVSRNITGSSSGKTVSESYAASTGALASQTTRQDASDADHAWKFAAGLGLYSGSFSWDIAVNDELLASSSAFTNPAYQSTLTWGY